jgi:hypothetical protein
MFCNGYTRVFLVFRTYVAKCFNSFRTYVANVSSRCCKSKFGVAHITVGPIYSNRPLQLLNPPTCAWVWRGRDWQAWETVWAHRDRAARDTEQRGTRIGHMTRCSVGPYVKQAQQHAYVKQGWASVIPGASLSVSTLVQYLFSGK